MLCFLGLFLWTSALAEDDLLYRPKPPIIGPMALAEMGVIGPTFGWENKKHIYFGASIIGLSPVIEKTKTTIFPFYNVGGGKPPLSPRILVGKSLRKFKGKFDLRLRLAYNLLSIGDAIVTSKEAVDDGCKNDGAETSLACDFSTIFGVALFLGVLVEGMHVNPGIEFKLQNKVRISLGLEPRFYYIDMEDKKSSMMTNLLLFANPNLGLLKEF